MCSLPIPCMISCSSCPLKSRCEKSTIFKLDLEWMDREKEKWGTPDNSLGGNYEEEIKV